MLSVSLMDEMIAVAVQRFATIHLLAADVRLSDSDQRVDLTEPSAPGYAPIPLSAWRFAPGETVHEQVEFKISEGAGTVYGWFICGADGEPLISTRSENPLVFGELGAVVKISPEFRLAPKSSKVKARVIV